MRRLGDDLIAITMVNHIVATGQSTKALIIQKYRWLSCSPEAQNPNNCGKTTDDTLQSNIYDKVIQDKRAYDAVFAPGLFQGHITKKSPYATARLIVDLCSSSAISSNYRVHRKGSAYPRDNVSI